jgi:hypothetical protein
VRVRGGGGGMEIRGEKDGGQRERLQDKFELCMNRGALVVELK